MQGAQDTESFRYVFNCIMEILPQINEQQNTEMFFHN